MNVVSHFIELADRRTGRGIWAEFVVKWTRKNALPIRCCDSMLIFCLLVCSLALCIAVSATANPLSKDRPALSIQWRVVPSSGAPLETPSVTEIVLGNNGDLELGNSGWQLHFNFSRQILSPETCEGVRFVHVNGDHYYLEPTVDFLPFRRGTQRAIRFETQLPLIKETDGPSGFFLVRRDNLQDGPQVVPLGEPLFAGIISKRQAMRSRDDLVTAPDARTRYEENLRLTPPIQQGAKIIPTPISWVARDGVALIRRNTVIVADSRVAREAAYLASSLEPLLGVRLEVRESANSLPGNAILLSLQDANVNGKRYVYDDNAYQLSVASGGDIRIQGTDAAGVFYGIQSLRASLPVECYRQTQEQVTVAAVEVGDVPQFKYRGMHLDVARNFQKKETVEKLLELMAFYKLNKFHFHLTDDEGWRLEIDGLPELTEIGGKRLFSECGVAGLPPSFGSGPVAGTTGSHGSGYYTRQEFVEILRFAAERHIEVIPEIDLPGHSRAAIRAMDVRYRRLLRFRNSNEPSDR